MKVVTNCAALWNTDVKKYLIPRIARWWLPIQDFDLNIEYRPGERMRYVESLSRNYLECEVRMIDSD